MFLYISFLTALDVATAFYAGSMIGWTAELSPFVSLLGSNAGLATNLVLGIVVTYFIVWAEWFPVTNWILRARTLAVVSNITLLAGLGAVNAAAVALIYLDAVLLFLAMNVYCGLMPSGAFLIE